MTEKKQGAAEWLRGIADKYDAEGGVGCREVAELFGLCCDKIRTCQECKEKAIRAIADRIDAERALPEGIEWPRFEDGELVRPGDEVEWDGDVMRVGAFWFHREGWSLNVFCPGLDGTFHGEYGERVKRPTPKVLDADGVPIKVGDAVYFVGGSGTRLSVKNTGFKQDGPFVYIIDENRYLATVNPEILTHERPDSWERIEEDAKLAPRDYLESRGMNPEKPERIASMMADLVRRAKALAKAGE